VQKLLLHATAVHQEEVFRSRQGYDPMQINLTSERNSVNCSRRSVLTPILRDKAEKRVARKSYGLSRRQNPEELTFENRHRFAESQPENV